MSDPQFPVLVERDGLQVEGEDYKNSEVKPIFNTQQGNFAARGAQANQGARFPRWFDD